MGADRVVKLKRATSVKAVREVVAAYIGAAGVVQRPKHGGMWFDIELPGTYSSPKCFCPWVTSAVRESAIEISGSAEPRFIEVWCLREGKGKGKGKGKVRSICVSTRFADPYTRDLATSLAEAVAFHFQGKVAPT